MRRQPDKMAADSFDVVIVGGGVHGACAAMEAAQRGLRTALIEKGDFSSATSHNSLKIVHGGIRYLQHLDFGRVRQSIVERRFWLRCAPHMVVPLEFWMPLRGLGTRGPAALWAGMRAHELLGWDRNKGVLPESAIPRGAIRGRSSVKRVLGNLWGSNPPRAAVWSDGQMIDADRLILECVVSASEHGTTVANYVEATGLERRQDGSIAGVRAHDVLSGQDLLIRTRKVVLAAGPWTVPLAAERLNDRSTERFAGLVRNMNVVIARKPLDRAVGIESRQRSDAVIGKSNRLLFITPWRNCSIVGTTHEPYDGDPDEYRVGKAEVADFLEEANRACPMLDLSPGDVNYVYAGLTPSEGTDDGAGRSKASEVVDHGRRGGATGLYSMIGVKYTTARSLAERVVDLIGKTEANVRPSRSTVAPFPGATGFRSMESLVEEIGAAGVQDTTDATDLAIAYGMRYRQVLDLVSGNFDRYSILDARVKHAVREEMAVRLSDVLYRRLDWLPRGLLDESGIVRVSQTMAAELGWDDDQATFQQETFDGLENQSVGACR